MPRRQLAVPKKRRFPNMPAQTLAPGGHCCLGNQMPQKYDPQYKPSPGLCSEPLCLYPYLPSRRGSGCREGCGGVVLKLGQFCSSLWLSISPLLGVAQVSGLQALQVPASRKSRALMRTAWGRPSTASVIISSNPVDSSCK